ncbi:acetyl-CoA carboxylase biotin carboxylase subunit family protein [Kitasatospora sp. NRRL B-11411]|uniref:ATP-grasp domain-containing protein n=1 Tax=Kitasatospora sp. NRRL B-11411 TaxID=1463822 RepID=UPI0004C368E1|nr:ATP-grasp domain-containing protein [Kitasatospora sp. NRRL B-11411]
MLVVLSALRSQLEDLLTERGQQILVVVPPAVEADRKARGVPYSMLTVAAWDNRRQLSALAGELAALPVESVVTTDEPCLRAAAFLRERLGLPGQSRECAIAGTDKHIQKDVLTAASVPVARHVPLDSVADIESAAELLGWPVVVKPRRGFGAIGTLLVRDQAHFVRLRAEGAFGPQALPASLHASGIHHGLDHASGGLMAEEGIDVAAEYHCEILRHHGREVYAVPGRYPGPLLDTTLLGSVLLGPDDEHAREVVDLARAAADALHLVTGFAHAEILLARSGDLLVGEIGLRPGGAMLPHLLGLQHGIDPWALAADLAMGLTPQVDLRSAGPVVAWAAPIAPPGWITDMDGVEALQKRPGVIDVHQLVHVGQQSPARVGTLTPAGHVFAAAATAAQAEARARQAAAAWRITTSDRPPHQASPVR